MDLGSDSGFPVFSLKPGLSHHCISLSLSFPSCEMGTMTSISRVPVKFSIALTFYPLPSAMCLFCLHQSNVFFESSPIITCRLHCC